MAALTLLTSSCAHAHTIRGDAEVAAAVRTAIDAHPGDFVPAPRSDLTLRVARIWFPDADAPEAWSTLRQHLLKISGSREATPRDTSYWYLRMLRPQVWGDSLGIGMLVGTGWRCPPPDSGGNESAGEVGIRAERDPSGGWRHVRSSGRGNVESVPCGASREFGASVKGIKVKRP